MIVVVCRLYQLHQFLQYHVIQDSKPVACLLLSLESVYPHSRQMALDMMDRLGTAMLEIVEILLEQGKVITALNYGKMCSQNIILIQLCFSC